MKRNLDTLLLDLKGEPVKEGVGGETRPVTVGSILIQSLLTLTQEDQSLAADAKVTRYKLGLKVAPGGEVELTSEDLALLKLLVGRLFSPLVVGRVYDWCESE